MFVCQIYLDYTAYAVCSFLQKERTKRNNPSMSRNQKNNWGKLDFFVICPCCVCIEPNIYSTSISFSYIDAIEEYMSMPNVPCPIPNKI